MAQLKPQPVSVTAPALTLVESNSTVRVRAHGQAAALSQLRPVARLVKAAGGCLAIDHQQHENNGSAQGFAEGCWLRLRSDSTPLNTAATSGSFSCYPVRGLRGILAARNADLSLTIVGVSPDANSETLKTAVAFAAPGISAPNVGVDSSLESRLGSNLAASRDAAQGIERQQFSAQYLDVGLCSAQLSQGEMPMDLDVLVVPLVQAEQVARHAAAVSGTRGLQVKTVVDQRGISVSVLPFSWVNQPQMDPSAVILAAVAMLLGTGQRDAAERLHNGWLATLESGMHTAAFKHIAPYTRRVSGDEFLTAVEAHLDQSPVRLRRASYNDRQQSGTARRPALRLVR